MSLPYFTTWSKQNTQTYFDLESASGVFLKTKDHQTIIDFSSTSYQASFGHNHPLIVAAIKNQLDQFGIASPKAHFNLKLEVSEKLLSLLESGSQLPPGGKILYTTSGAESVENAIKLARKLTNQKIILSRKTCYHGATLGAMSISGDWRNEAHQTVSEWNAKIPDPLEDPDLKKTTALIEKIGAQNIAGLCLETITGGNGVIIPDPKWWQGIQALCHKFKILLIADEIICGFYRTLKPFGFHHYDISPDIICMAKAITGGMIPFGAVWVHPKLAKIFDNEIFAFGLTNVGHPLGLCATDAVLKLTENSDFQTNLNQIHKLFKSELEKLKQLECVNEIRQIGLLSAIDIKVTITWDKFFEAGLYLVTSEKRIIIAPPLTIQAETLKNAFKQLTSILEQA